MGGRIVPPFINNSLSESTCTCWHGIALMIEQYARKSNQHMFRRIHHINLYASDKKFSRNIRHEKTPGAYCAGIHFFSKCLTGNHCAGTVTINSSYMRVIVK